VLFPQETTNSKAKKRFKDLKFKDLKIDSKISKFKDSIPK